MAVAWPKCLLVAALGLTAYSFLEAAEFSRQDYEITVCTSNSTGVEQCLFSSATDNTVWQGSLGVASMGLAAFLANGLATPGIPNMVSSFAPHHLLLVMVWFFLSWAMTIVPLVYTCYLLAQQANNWGGNLDKPVSDNQSALLLAVADPDTGVPYNPCNVNNFYCPSIDPGLLAGFGYLFLGATAFWVGWVLMDHTAKEILAKGEEPADEEANGAYASAAPAPERQFVM